MLEQIKIVLIETSHPGNIGAAARAMKTMGLRRLALVNPTNYPCVEATARAAGADDVLAAAEIHTDLHSALRECSLVLGTSARQRRTLRWPLVSPQEAAVLASQEPAGLPVAIVFGRERSGLSNAELALCHSLINIPVDPAYSSLNLAAAVQVICYELRLRALSENPQVPEQLPTETPATVEMLESFYEHLQTSMVEAGYLDPENPRHLLPRLRRLFNKARPSVNEINILRGFLKACSNTIRRHNTKL